MERIEEALNDCLERMAGGESIESCLASYPDVSEELWSLLVIAEGVAGTTTLVKPRADFKAAARYRFYSALADKDKKTSKSKAVPRRWGLRWATVAIAVLFIFVIGGGTGIAPIYFLAKVLHNNGLTPTVLMGSRDKEGLLRIDDFKQFGEIFYTTEDGSAGEKGFVTHHSILKNAAAEYDMIYSCGPEPMMKAVGQLALKNNIDCEVSLENLMACGVGACLCCVVETNSGNICTCTEGPIFKVKDLKW